LPSNIHQDIAEKLITRCPQWGPLVYASSVASRLGPWNGSAGRYTSSPWEGLYWEADQKNPSIENETAIDSTELESFLMSLMYGE
jgi:hypothetical protein